MKRIIESNKQEKWLITGGCGFIGLNLIQDLLKEEKYSIRIIDNLISSDKADLRNLCNFKEISINKQQILESREGNSINQVNLIVGDILDEEIVMQATKGIDTVVHLAANTGVGPSVENPRKDMENNTIGTFNMLEVSRINKVKNFIFASSGAPIGECIPPIHEECPPHPVSPYGASKLCGEGYCSAYYNTFGLKTVILRFSNVYGPRSMHKNSVVAKIIKNVMSGKTITIYGDGNQSRDFIYVKDLVKAIRLASTVPDVGGEIFQIATNKETTINDITHLILKIARENGCNQNIPIKYEDKRVGDVLRNYSIINKAKGKLGWNVEYSLEEGIRNTVMEFLENDGKNK